jgi:hypothetical protein
VRIGLLGGTTVIAALLIVGGAPAIAQLTPEQRCLQFAANNGDFATFDPVTGICHEFGPNTNNNFPIVDPLDRDVVHEKLKRIFPRGRFNSDSDQLDDFDAEIDALRRLGLSDEAINLLFQTSDNVPNLVTARSQLGMYISHGTADASVFGGAAVTRNSGYGVSDSAGLVAPGTTAPSFKDVAGGGGVAGSYDLNLSGNQSLRFSGSFDYRRVDMTLGALAGLGLASAGSVQTDTYRFGGAVIYGLGSAYLEGKAAFDFGHGNETQTVDGSTGRFDTHGYSADLRIGNVFMLLNTLSSGTATRMPTKAPPKAAGGYAVGLDLSGHLGYSNERIDGFTDSAGFVYGADRTRYGDIGGRAKLFAVVPNNGLLWMPYVAGTVDQQFGFSSTLTIPDQVALPGGDIVSLQQAQTFLGTQLGLDIRGAGGWKIGARGFYSASSDTNITGGSAYVKIPFNYTSAVASRY